MASAALLSAAENSIALVNIFAETDEVFDARPESDRAAKWWTYLAEKGKPVVAPPHILNMITRLDTLRKLFNEYPWLEQEDDWLKRLLLDGHVLCRCCGRHNSKVGSLLANTAKVKRHMESSVHAAKAAAYDARARRLSEMPSGPKARPAAQAVREVRHMLEAAVIGRLVSGGNGAAGIPPSSVDKVFSKELLEAIKCMSNGFPQETAILDRVLPDAVRHVKDRIKTKLSDMPLVLYIDGGSSHLADGRKVVCVCGSSMGLEYDLLLDLVVLDCHENSEIQAEIIESVRADYHIKKTDVWYLCADNAALNAQTVTKLNTKYGYKIIYVRCLPHCLNLVVKTFLDVFDDKYKLATNLKLMRAFLNAGGGIGHKLLALEFGISASRVDFCDTRWASFLKAILYLVNLQPERDMKLATERLKQLWDDEGDEDAKRALDEGDKPCLVFNAMWAFIEVCLALFLLTRARVIARTLLTLPATRVPHPSHAEHCRGQLEEEEGAGQRGRGGGGPFLDKEEAGGLFCQPGRARGHVCY